MTERKTQRSFFNRMWSAMRGRPSARYDQDQGRAASRSEQRQRPRSAEAGNVFFTLFGAVAVVGVLGAGIMSTMRGPLSTMVEVNRMEEAKAKMRLNARLIIADVDQNGPFGTCGNDDIGNGGTLEFAEARGYATGSPNPAGGGHIPGTIGGQKNDPWGTPYGYCVWDNGADVGGCQSNMLPGENSPNTMAIALVSAGPDRQFNTSCTQAGDDDAQNDDIVEPLSYPDAVSAAGGGGGSYWTENSGNSTIESTAPIAVGGDSTTTSTFGGGASFGNNLVTSGTVITDSIESTTGTGGTVTFTSDMAGVGLTLSDTLDVSGITSLDGATTIDNTLTVTGTTTLAAAEINGNITAADGEVNVNSGIAITGNTTVGGTLGVTGATTLNATEINGNITANDGTVNIDDALDISGDTAVTGNLSATADLTVSGVSTLGAAVTINAPGMASGTNAFTINNGTPSEIFAVDEAGNVSFAGDLQITGATAGQILVSDGSGNFSNVSMSGDATLAANGTLTIANNAITNDKILDDTITGAKLNLGSGTNGDCVKMDGDVIYTEACSEGGGGDGVGTEGFIDLSDTPDNYASAAADAGKAVIVNPAGDGLIFRYPDRIADATTPNPDTYIDVDTTNDGSTNSIVFWAAALPRMSLNNSVFLLQDNADLGYMGVVADRDNDGIGSQSSFRLYNNGSADINHVGSFAFRENSATVAINYGAATLNHLTVHSSGRVGINTDAVNASAQFQIDSTSRGFLPPRMTESERNAINAPATGLMIFNTNAGDRGLFQFWDGNEWVDIGAGGAEGTGIWSDSPDGNFIEYDDNALGGMRVGRVSGQSAPATDWLLDSTNSVVFTTANKVGIGTSTINGSLALDVEGAIGATQYCDQDGDNCFTHADVSAGGGGLWTQNPGDTNEIYYDAGNVGIGVTDPSSTLEVATSTGNTVIKMIADPSNSNENNNPWIEFIQDGNASFGYIGLVGDNGSAFNRSVVGSISNSLLLSTWKSGGAHPLQFSVDDQVHMTIRGNGFVGVGTNNPGEKLSVTGRISIDNDNTVSGIGCLQFDGSKLQYSNNCSTYYDMGGKWLDGSTSGEIYYNTGNVGIGKDDPATALDVVGAVSVSDRIKIAGTAGDAPVYITSGGSGGGGGGGGASLWQEGATSGEIYYNGNVGIGNADPSGPLDILSGTSGASNMRFNDSSQLQIYGGDNSSSIQLQGGGGSGYYADWIMFNNNWSKSWSTTYISSSDRLMIEHTDSSNHLVLNPTNGRTGLGAADPATKLDVRGTLRLGDGAEDCATAIEGSMRFNTTDDTFEVCVDDGDWTAIATGTGSSVWQAGSGSEIYYSAGNVGIGTNNPDSALDVTGDIIARTYASNAAPLTKSDLQFMRASGSAGSEGAIANGNHLGQIRWQGYDGNSYEYTALISAVVNGTVSDENIPTDLTFHTASSYGTDGALWLTNSERMRITSAGNVGIGTNAPDGGLHVYEDAAKASIVIEGAETEQSLLDFVTTGDGETSVENGSRGWQLFAFGNSWGNSSLQNDFGIVYRNGGVWTEFIYMDSYGQNVGILNDDPQYTLDVTGDIRYTGSLFDTSDRRLKQDITPLDKEELKRKIAQINTYSFHMKDSPDGPLEFGVIAQEMEEIFPNLVRTEDNAQQYKSVNYNGLVAPLISVSQDLIKENEDLKSQLSEMKAQQELILASLNEMQDDIKGVKIHTGYGLKKAAYDYWMLALALAMFVGSLIVVTRRKAG